MIHIVTCRNRHLYRSQIWDMFNERRKAFYERCGWRDLMVFDGGEVDDFDDERAVYLLALDEDARLDGAVRARPTEDRCILVDKYPQMVGPDTPPLKGPEVWETTRIFTTKRYRDRREPGSKRTFEIALASMEVIFDAGGQRMIGMIDLHLLPMLMDNMGTPQFTGPPMDYAYGTMIGTWTAIDAAELTRLRETMQESEIAIAYEVDDDDIEAFGSLAETQRVVDRARSDQAAAIDEDTKFPLRTMAHITALYAKHDAGAAQGEEGLLSA